MRSAYPNIKEDDEKQWSGVGETGRPIGAVQYRTFSRRFKTGKGP